MNFTFGDKVIYQGKQALYLRDVTDNGYYIWIIIEGENVTKMVRINKLQQLTTA
jgi:hypothetical protein